MNTVTPAYKTDLPSFDTWESLPDFMNMDDYFMGNRRSFDSQGDYAAWKNQAKPAELFFGPGMHVAAGPNYRFNGPGSPGGASWGGYLVVTSESHPDDPPKLIRFPAMGWDLITLHRNIDGSDPETGSLRFISRDSDTASSNGRVDRLTDAACRGYGNILWCGERSGDTDCETTLVDQVHSIESKFPGWTSPRWLLEITQSPQIARHWPWATTHGSAPALPR